MAIRKNLSIFAQAGTEKIRQFSGRSASSRLPWLKLSTATPERLILAPQDLRTPDISAADETLKGRFFLAGTLIDCGETSPFKFEKAPFAWQKELHGFGWLRHLEARHGQAHKALTQTLINDWLINHQRIKNSVAWQDEVAAKRLISWLCHSVPVVEAATPRFYQQWLKSIGNHIRFLKHRINGFPEGIPKLTGRIALAYAAVCVSGQKTYLGNAAKSLDHELSLQILEDGGHISRNPSLLADILALLLPLRQSYGKLGLAPSQVMVSSIDRMMAGLKFYQMGDGNLARFNGTSVGRPELISTIRFYDDSMGKPSENASFSGYQRLEMGDSILIADTGAPPKGPYSESAHAGTLSFELSSGKNLLMVNCGYPVERSPDLNLAARSTAAHTTATLNDTSSSRFYRGTRFQKLLGTRIVYGPVRVPCERIDTQDYKQFTASHDGYRDIGIIHKRIVRMTKNGHQIEGNDQFLGLKGKPLNPKRPANFCIRFHLHPSVSAGKTDNGRSVILMCGSGIIWKLTCIDCLPEISDSIYFASASGPRRTRQVTLSGDARTISDIRWLLVKQENIG